MKEKMLYLAFVMRNFGRSLLDASKSLSEESRLLKRLKTTNKENANYNNYIHYITNKELVKAKKVCSFSLQKNYKKLHSIRRSVLKTTNKKV